MSYPYIYPFVAVVGQDDVKEAILLALVNPKIGGLLISGTKATAKSTLLRSAMALTEQALVMKSIFCGVTFWQRFCRFMKRRRTKSNAKDFPTRTRPTLC